VLNSTQSNQVGSCTTDGTVNEARHSVKSQRTDLNVSEDFLNRQSQGYGLVSPEWDKKLFSVTGQVNSSQRVNLSSDNLTLLVFIHETLSSISHNMKSVTHHPFVPLYYALVLLKTLFLSLVSFTTVCGTSKKKNCDWSHIKYLPYINWSSTRFLRRVSHFGFRSEYSVNTQTEPKTKIYFGLSKP
jgi:hypothetical protein